eukprot:scpid107800/ scgid20973/ 
MQGPNNDDKPTKKLKLISLSPHKCIMVLTGTYDKKERDDCLSHAGRYECVSHHFTALSIMHMRLNVRQITDCAGCSTGQMFSASIQSCTIGRVSLRAYIGYNHDEKPFLLCESPIAIHEPQT